MLFFVYFIGSTKRFWPGNKYNSWWVSWTSFFYQGMDDIRFNFNLLWLTWHNVYTFSFELGIFVLQEVIVFCHIVLYIYVWSKRLIIWSLKNFAFYPRMSYRNCSFDITKKEKIKYMRERERGWMVEIKVEWTAWENGQERIQIHVQWWDEALNFNMISII
jgi:hypothetical protein